MKNSLAKVNNSKGKSLKPLDGADPLEGDISSQSSRYYLRKGRHTNFRYSK
jgi:hypothetical protein